MRRQRWYDVFEPPAAPHERYVWDGKFARILDLLLFFTALTTAIAILNGG